MSEEVQLSGFCEKSVNAKHTVKKIEDALYLPAPVSNGTILVIALLFFFVMRNYSNSSFHFLWSFVMASSAVYRLFLWYKRNNSLISHSDFYWINHYSLSSLIVGCAWGSIYLLPYSHYDLTVYGILVMAFFGVTASAVPILSISLVAFLSYTLPILICVIVFIFNLDHVFNFALIAPIMAYYIMLLLLARNSKKQRIHSINLQLQKETLIEQLRDEVVQRESLIKARTEELEHSNQQILDSENRLQNVIAGAQLGYWDWDYQTGEHVVNDRWLEILGLSPGDIENNVTDWDMRIHPDDKNRMIAIVEEAIKKKKPYVADFRMKHKDGYWVWIQGSGSLIESDSLTQEPIRLCGTHQDITYRKNMEEELKYSAKHDYLTGLLNRVELEKNFQKELVRSQRYQHKLSVFLIDVDHFKKVNDTYGHLTGDQVLKKYAAFLQETVRSSDLVARYGGEEFVVILPETSVSEAEELAERLRLKTNALNIDLKDRIFNISISLGIATFPEHGQSYDQILEHADMAMYHAKQSGRNRVHTWSQ